VTRWNRRLLLGAIAVLVPALAGCEAGLNAPTLTYHPAAYGATTMVNGITIDNVFVLGPGLNSVLPAGGQAGVFVAMQAENGDRLVSVSAPGTASSVKVAGGSVDLPQQTLVDLSGPVPKIVLTGLSTPLSGGQTVQLVLNFATAGLVMLSVPVEPRAYDYATYSPPPIPKPAPSPTVTPTARAKATRSGSVSPRASASPSITR
jgi:copper(I)-binding protein